MGPLFISVGVFACVSGGAVLGMYLSPLLPVHQQSSESKDIVRLGMGLVATTVAVVLGLLVSSANKVYSAIKSGTRVGEGLIDKIQNLSLRTTTNAH